MQGILLRIFLLFVLVACASAQQHEFVSWDTTLSLSGMLETSYVWNFNDPASRRNGYRVFDFDHDMLRLDVAEVVLQRDLATDGVGFRIDVAAGTAIPRVTRSAGFNAGDIDIQQAFLSYVAPIPGGLRVDVGKFVTPAGYELIDGYDGINDNASRSILFGYAIPFTHTGLRAGFAPVEGLTATLYLVNGWDVAVDNNGSKSVGIHLLATPVEGLTLAGCLLHGAERDSTDDTRTLVDIVGTWTTGGLITVGINVDYGSEEGAVVDGVRATWAGMAGYLRVNLAESFSVTLRGETFDDADGARTGLQQSLQSFTLTPEFRPQDNLTLRADLRLDRSTVDVFDNNGDLVAVQPTVGISAVVGF